jgi:hypothetical protein
VQPEREREKDRPGHLHSAVGLICIKAHKGSKLARRPLHETLERLVFFTPSHGVTISQRCGRQQLREEKRREKREEKKRRREEEKKRRRKEKEEKRREERDNWRTSNNASQLVK